ncbi:hypothetical protein GCM10025785_05210 [Corynebacterium canis]
MTKNAPKICPGPSGWCAPWVTAAWKTLETASVVHRRTAGLRTERPCTICLAARDLPCFRAGFSWGNAATQDLPQAHLHAADRAAWLTPLRPATMKPLAKAPLCVAARHIADKLRIHTVLGQTWGRLVGGYTRWLRAAEVGILLGYILARN